MRKVNWIGTSRSDLQALSDDIRRRVGHALFFAQSDLPHPSIKILHGFGGASVREIKADDESGTFRAVYTVRFKDLLYVLHVFQKKSKVGIATTKADIFSIKQRLKRATEDFRLRSADDEKERQQNK